MSTKSAVTSTVTSAVVAPSADPVAPGWCLCNCNQATRGGFYMPGHDTIALKAAMRAAGYESVAHFIFAHNLVPAMPAGFVKYEAPKPVAKAKVEAPVVVAKPVVKAPVAKPAPVVQPAAKPAKAKKAA